MIMQWPGLCPESLEKKKLCRAQPDSGVVYIGRLLGEDIDNLQKKKNSQLMKTQAAAKKKIAVSHTRTSLTTKLEDSRH